MTPPTRGTQASSVFVVALLLLAAAGVACGDVYADPEGVEEPIEQPPRLDSGLGSSVFPKDIARTCPSSRPRENSVCGSLGATCEYGKSADLQCNAVLACVGNVNADWEARPSDACFGSVCPALGTADVGSLDGKPCTIDPAAPDGGPPITNADEAICNMTDGVCACTTGSGGTTAHERRWVCIRPLSACPANRPLAGQSCNGELWCDYGSCAFKRGLLMECKEGRWLTGGAPCH